MRKKKRSNALYVHVPFCQHLCHYCDFTKLLYDEKKADLYIDRLITEIQGYGITNVASLYLGGGTPTALSLSQLEKLLKTLAPL
ncbi:MAG: oxygen-independent coproporphyrinogen III oxidase, partial [Firmicutes bacterium]|nr:oxygen-independent coproporphyrinogen III oxidase [Bacillota bacterium]